mgnify:CR=1 FL=1
MFSVNVDKLVSMTAEEKGAYSELADKILQQDENIKTIAIYNGGASSLKIAGTLCDAGKKVIFADADLSSPVFMNKYKLGKNLMGICDFFTGKESADNIICLTDRDNLNIAFTGNTLKRKISDMDTERFSVLLNIFKEKYDFIIADVAKSADYAVMCDAIICFMEESEYSEEKAESEVDALTEKGGFVLGVVLTTER